MASKPIAPEIRQRYKNTIEECLRDGYDPYRAVEKRGKGSAVEEAVRRLMALGFDATRNKLQTFVNTEEKRAGRGEENYLPDWNLFAPPGLAYTTTARPSGKIRRWILTSAQDDTDFHPKFWNNIQAFASALNAQISISGFTYQTMRHTDRATLTNTYRKELRPFLRFESMDCGPVLWCAEMNILPTAVKPLSGMEGYSRGRDAIFPHAKSQMTTIPQAMGDHVPVLLTTGAVTVTNYIPKKAGQKAKFHHNLGFVLVEVDGRTCVTGWLFPIP